MEPAKPKKELRSFLENIDKTERNIYRLSIWILIVGAILAVIAFLSLKHDYEKIHEDVIQTRFRIISPADKSEVSLSVKIEGETPYPDFNHYIIISPVNSGDDFVQSKAVVVSQGLWVGMARFGDGPNGIGQEFIVRCAATKSTIREGSNPVFPQDVKFTPAITVTRTK